jgi:hypothetical protein
MLAASSSQFDPKQTSSTPYDHTERLPALATDLVHSHCGGNHRTLSKPYLSYDLATLEQHVLLRGRGLPSVRL